MTADTDEWMFPHHHSPLVTFENKDGVTLGRTAGGVGNFEQITNRFLMLFTVKIPYENMFGLIHK